jgi:very-short-patch-repair endonuclease
MVKSSTRYAKKYFICAGCDTNPPIVRLARPNNESPPEREVREALTGCGFSVVAEYPLGHFIYDFAVPRLRLLMEIDSKSYHRFPRQIKRDQLKTAFAKEQHWELVRLRTSSELRLAAIETVRNRAQALGVR